MTIPMPPAGRWWRCSAATAGSSIRPSIRTIATARLDVRSLCLIRETLARHDGLADFAFAMQGLGTGAISLFGTDDAEARMAAEDARPARRSRPSR